MPTLLNGAFVYRLGHGPLKAERRVRFPYALPLICKHLRRSASKSRLWNSVSFSARDIEVLCAAPSKHWIEGMRGVIQPYATSLSQFTRTQEMRRRTSAFHSSTPPVPLRFE